MSTSHHKQVETMTRAITSSVIQSSKELKTHFTTQSSLLESAMRQHVSSFANQMQSCPNASSQQLETLTAMIGQLQDQVKHLAAGGRHARVQEVSEDTVDVDMDEDSNQNTLGEDIESLDASLGRLFSLASDRRSTVFSLEAQGIIDDIEQLLQLVTKDNCQRSGKSLRRRRIDEVDDASDQEEIEHQHRVKRIRGVLTASQCLALNSPGLELIEIVLEIH